MSSNGVIVTTHKLDAGLGPTLARPAAPLAACIQRHPCTNTNKIWLPWQRHLRDRKTNFRLVIYSHSSTNLENLAKIRRSRRIARSSGETRNSGGHGQISKSSPFPPFPVPLPLLLPHFHFPSLPTPLRPSFPSPPYFQAVSVVRCRCVSGTWTSCGR